MAAVQTPEGFNQLKPGQVPQFGDLVVIPGRTDLVMTVDRNVMRDYSIKLKVHTIDVPNGVTRSQPLDQFIRTHPTAQFYRK